MRKLDNKGFILAETLIVSIFLLLMFTMIYSNYFPIIGEYEQRENYDDVDGKYVAYWIKKLIESEQYKMIFDDATFNAELVESSIRRVNSLNTYGYMRFECKDVVDTDGQREVCKNLVNAFEISNCDAEGNDCDIFITHYQIGASTGTHITPNFKETVKNNSLKRYMEYCVSGESETDCKNKYFNNCCVRKGLSTCYDVNSSSVADSYSGPKDQASNDIARYCRGLTNSRIFAPHVKDYILSLPNYTYKHFTTNSEFRVIVVVHHVRDYNDYYSYSTMEVDK